MKVIYLSSEEFGCLSLLKVSDKYLHNGLNYSYSLWINQDTDEILSPRLYSDLDNIVSGNFILINGISYLVRDIKLHHC